MYERLIRAREESLKILESVRDDYLMYIADASIPLVKRWEIFSELSDTLGRIDYSVYEVKTILGPMFLRRKDKYTIVDTVDEFTSMSDVTHVPTEFLEDRTSWLLQNNSYIQEFCRIILAHNLRSYYNE